MALWTPADYGAPVKHWYDIADAATLTDVGAGVISAWNDKSGGGHNLAQATSGKRGTRTASNANFYNKPTIAFPSAGGMTTALDSAVDPGQWIVDGGSGGFSTGAVGAAPGASAPQNVVVVARIPAALLTTSNVLHRYNGATKTNTWDDGAGITPAFAGTSFMVGRWKGYGQGTTFGRIFEAAGGTLAVGNRASDYARTGDFDFAEIILVAGSLSTSDIELFEGYLSWKWAGDGSLLPSGHPYKSAAPTTASSYAGAGAMAGVGSLSGTAQASRPLAGSAAGAGALAGAASADKPLAAAGAGLGDLTAVAQALRPMAGSATGAGGLIGAALADKPLAAAAVGAGDLIGAAAALKPMDGAASGLGALTASTGALWPLEATAAGIGALTGVGGRVIPATLQAVGAGDLAATAGAVRPGVALLVGLGVLAGDASANRPAAGAAFGIGAIQMATQGGQRPRRSVFFIG